MKKPVKPPPQPKKKASKTSKEGTGSVDTTNLTDDKEDNSKMKPAVPSVILNLPSAVKSVYSPKTVNRDDRTVGETPNATFVSKKR